MLQEITKEPKTEEEAMEEDGESKEEKENFEKMMKVKSDGDGAGSSSTSSSSSQKVVKKEKNQPSVMDMFKKKPVAKQVDILIPLVMDLWLTLPFARRREGAAKTQIRRRRGPRGRRRKGGRS